MTESVLTRETPTVPTAIDGRPYAEGLLDELRGELRELPGTRIRRLEPVVGFELALGLVAGGRDRLYEAVAAAGADPRAAANVLMNQFAAAGVDPDAVDAGELAALIEARDRIPRASFLEALASSAEPGFTAERYLAEAVVTDATQLEPLVERVLAANGAQVEQYRAGKQGLLGFFVGQVMRETQGKANPKLVNELVREKLHA